MIASDGWEKMGRKKEGGYREKMQLEFEHMTVSDSMIPKLACFACRQASGGFKGSNRDGLVFELAHTKLILRQVVQAMQGVHGHATLHGDVKPDNFLVSCCYLNKA